MFNCNSPEPVEAQHSDNADLQQQVPEKKNSDPRWQQKMWQQKKKKLPHNGRVMNEIHKKVCQNHFMASFWIKKKKFPNF